MRRFGKVEQSNSNSVDIITDLHGAPGGRTDISKNDAFMGRNAKETDDPVLRVFIHYQLTIHDVHIQKRL